MKKTFTVKFLAAFILFMIASNSGFCDGKEDPSECHEDPCQWARDNGLYNGETAGVVCCRNENGPSSTYICVWNSGLDGHPGGEALEACIEAHEQHHIDSGLAACGYTSPEAIGGRLVSRPGVPPEDYSDEECAAHLAQLECIQDAIDYCLSLLGFEGAAICVQDPSLANCGSCVWNLLIAYRSTQLAAEQYCDDPVPFDPYPYPPPVPPFTTATPTPTPTAEPKEDP